MSWSYDQHKLKKDIDKNRTKICGQCGMDDPDWPYDLPESCQECGSYSCRACPAFERQTGERKCQPEIEAFVMRIFTLIQQRSAGYWFPKDHGADEMIGVLEYESVRSELDAEIQANLEAERER